MDDFDLLPRWAVAHETKGHVYTVHTDGSVLSITRKHHVERVLTPYFKGKPTGGAMMVKMGDREEAVKYLVAEAFLPGFKRSSSVNLMHRDGDITNCSVWNLEVKTKAEVSAITGPMSRSRPVRVVLPDGSEQVFPSVRACGRALYVSYQTVLDRLAGKYKKGVLDGYELEYV